MDVQGEKHGSWLRAFVDQLIADSDLHIHVLSVASLVALRHSMPHQHIRRDIPLLARFVPASVEGLVSNLDDAAHYCSAPDSHNDCCRYDHYCSRNRDASYDSNDGDGAAAADIALAWDGDSNSSHRTRSYYQQPQPRL